MGNPVKGILERLAKWIVRHGADELEKELERQRNGAPEAARDPAPSPRDMLLPPSR